VGVSTFVGVLLSLARSGDGSADVAYSGSSVRVAVRYIFFGRLEELPNLVWLLGPGTTQDLQAWQTTSWCVALPVREHGLQIAS
jgi:hypothetical protein